MTEDKQKADWLKMKPAEIEKIVLELHKEGNSSANIGLILRDKYGVPKAKLLGKSIGTILKENKVIVKSEKTLVQDKMNALIPHMEKHRHDYPAKRSYNKKQWIINKLTKQEANAN